MSDEVKLLMSSSFVRWEIRREGRIDVEGLDLNTVVWFKYSEHDEPLESGETCVLYVRTQSGAQYVYRNELATGLRLKIIECHGVGTVNGPFNREENTVRMRADVEKNSQKEGLA